KFTAPAGPRISIKTDVISMQIALRNAEFTGLNLLGYTHTLKDKTPFALLAAQPDDYRTVTPGLASEALPRNLQYPSARQHYTLAPNTQTLVVPLRWSGHGLTITRKLIFTRGSYEVHARTKIRNAGSQPVTLTPGVRILGQN